MFHAEALGGVVVTGLLFSAGNALLEELVFRGVLFDAIETMAGGWRAVIGTAAIFGYLRLHGYPPGPWGAVLAGTFWLCLGWLRLRTGGLGLAVLVHLAADATIYVLVHVECVTEGQSLSVSKLRPRDLFQVAGACRAMRLGVRRSCGAFERPLTQPDHLVLPQHPPGLLEGSPAYESAAGAAHSEDAKRGW